MVPSSIFLATVTIPALVGLASAIEIAKRERKNEYYADLQAFRNCDFPTKNDIMTSLQDKLQQEKPQSRIKRIFSGYPFIGNRYSQLYLNPQNDIVFRKDLEKRWKARHLMDKQIELE